MEGKFLNAPSEGQGETEQFIPSIATVRKEDRDGDAEIIREGFKLFKAHLNFFLLVQLTLMLPLAIVTVVCEYVAYTKLPRTNRPAPVILPLIYTSTAVVLSLSELYPTVESWLHFGFAVISMLLIIAGILIIFQAAVSVPSAAILYAVGLHSTGRNVSFKDVLIASVPTLWMRLTVTGIYKVFLQQSVVLVQSMGFMWFSKAISQNSSILFMLPGVVLLVSLILVGNFAVEIFFMTAPAVSVLEKDYGWAAARRSLKLLKGRPKVVLFFQMLWLVLQSIDVNFKSILQNDIITFNGFFLVDCVLYIVWKTCLWQMSSILTGVQYVSLKASHDEDLAKSFCDKQKMKIGFELVPSEIDDAKVDGQQTGDSV